MPFPHTEKFARGFISTSYRIGKLSKHLSDMIYQEATEKIIQGARNALDVYDLKLIVTWGGFIAYPSMYDIGRGCNTRLYDMIEDRQSSADFYDWFYNLIEALQKDGVDLSHLWKITDDQVFWKFSSDEMVYTKSIGLSGDVECSLSANGKLLYAGETTSDHLRDLLQDYWCPVYTLLDDHSMFQDCRLCESCRRGR